MLLDNIPCANDNVDNDGFFDEFEGFGSEPDIVQEALSEGVNEAIPTDTNENFGSENDPADFNNDDSAHGDDIMRLHESGSERSASLAPNPQAQRRISTPSPRPYVSATTVEALVAAHLNVQMPAVASDYDSESSFASRHSFEQNDGSDDDSVDQDMNEMGKGRPTTFAVEIPTYTPTQTTPPPTRKRTLSLTRDNHGRFAPKTPLSGEATSTASKRKRARSSSAVSRPVSAVSQERDSNGRFAGKTPSRSADSAKSEKPKSILQGDLKFLARTQHGPPSSSKKSPSSNIKSLDSTKVHQTPIRDTKGRFAPKGNSSTSHIQQFMPAESDTWSDQESTYQEKEEVVSKAQKKKRQPAKSPFFVTPSKAKGSKGSKGKQPQTPKKTGDDAESSQVSPKKRTPAKTVSCIPFPPLSAPHFGLIQEKLAHDPFRLLIAVTFLIRTHGKHAIPVFFELMEKCPTPEALIAANKDDIVSIIRRLGLQHQRAETYKIYAQIWLEDPPTIGRRYPVRGYPDPDSAKNVGKDDILDDEDERHAWEIGHMTSGPYALDSWRIFCRDRLRGLAESWNGEGREEGFQPEWMRVVPQDKELRAYLRWMWLKEGFEWDPFTGDKEVARPELMRAAMEGRIAWDDQGGMRIVEDGEAALGVASQSAGLQAAALE